jgi:phenylalanyl-tRNA synthetase beta subunit
MSDEQDRLHLDLKGARERLCRAQVHVPSYWRNDLQEALDIIDNVGSSTCAQWSIHDQPEYPEAK